MFDWIKRYIEGKILDWIAGQLGMDPSTLKPWLDEIFAFLRSIIGVFSSPQEAIAWMDGYVAAAKTSKVAKQDRKQLLEKLVREL